ncbi:putative secretion ATPase (PEP-CTERM system associated) [Sphaerotilus hippei]|uniref:Putative secretion ATPase (PEP-CTERM system associated) n=1 Tax=Sphaerotilus hippei TaxID=744406 RepID=A0A318GX87_9BURK|nr:XrtA/PEP-CTERM system-associated ATPase [Sphaerotilus hippei]PXW94127.1 putative secretion ATPase (PEP-CTERM system associated) [Sphaerotilus hippei]
MYESHFGFSNPPFQLNPDPSFYFNSAGHSRALAYLQYGVTQGEGFIVVTGDIGAGKTTLVRTLIDGLDRQKVLAAQIVSTQLEAGDLLQSIITAFGIPTIGSSKAHLIATLEAFLTALAGQGRHALLIVDEAQNLSPRAVEELRMLSNFQLGNRSLLQSFLVGQPELRQLIESMEQLRQRISASCHLGPLGLQETRDYILHRLRRVGWQDRPVFDPGSLEQIHRWSGGVPRRINRLCNRVLLASFLDGDDHVTPQWVEQLALELHAEMGDTAFQPLALDASADPLEAGVAGAADVAGPAAAARPPAESLRPAAPAEASRPAMAMAPASVEGLPWLTDVVRFESSVSGAPVQGDVVFCLADTASAALKFAALARVLAAGGEPLRLVLVNPGLPARVWPWEPMDRLLPGLPLSVHLGLPDGRLEAAAALLFTRMTGLIDELRPVAALSLGASDAVLACAMASRQHGVPLVCLEAGDRHPCSPVRASPAGDNAGMIEQLSDLLLASDAQPALCRLQQQGIAPARVMSIAGGLDVDSIGAVWREATTPYGAFMRHGLPVHLGPALAGEPGEGTPYAVAVIALQPGEQVRAQALCTLLSRVTAVPKVVWLIDETTRGVLAQVLAADAALAAQVCLVVGEGPHDANVNDRMNRSVLLCREVPALQDQLSILRGSRCALVEPGQVLADAAELLDLPFVHVDADALALRSRRQGVLAQYPLQPEALNACLQALAALAPAPDAPLQIREEQGAVTGVARHLRHWLARRRHAAAGPGSEPVAQPLAA